MEKLTEKYRLSIYTEIVELSEGKIYIVKSSLDDKIYIKKILDIENHEIYKEIKKLNISNTPKIYEIIDLDNKLIIIEEYINGYSLKEILEKSKIISETRVIKYMLDLVDILESLYSSSLQIIHRDIKPSNIMINNDDILKLIDFDISRIHKSDQSTDTNILGTYGYAAPEQFGFNQSDTRTDIYSIGVTMNKLLTGKFPIEELYKGNLSKIISKCIELDPKNRFQDIEELKNALLRQKKKSKVKNKGHDNFKLPGFRSRNSFFMLISSLWYMILAMTLLGLFTDEKTPKARVEDMSIVLYFFALTLIYGNYRDIKSKLPMTRSKNLLIKILGYILYTLLLFVVLGLVIT